jgi:hypothetical protein
MLHFTKTPRAQLKSCRKKFRQQWSETVKKLQLQLCKVFNIGCRYPWTLLVHTLKKIFYDYRSYKHTETRNTLKFAVKVKVKVTRHVQILAHRGRGGIAPLFPNYGTRKSEWLAARPGPIYPREGPRYPLYRGLDGPQSRSGRRE